LQIGADAVQVELRDLLERVLQRSREWIDRRLDEELILAVEVAIDHAFADACLVRDLFDRATDVAAGGEGTSRRLENEGLAVGRF
jgi:hypothetical protein